MLIFTKLIPLKPVSINSYIRDRDLQKRYQEKLAGLLKGVSYSKVKSTDRLYCTLIYFAHSTTEVPDTDNILKPVIDFFIGKLYDDDKIIKHCVAIKLDMANSKSWFAVELNPSVLFNDDISIINKEDSVLIEIGKVPVPATHRVTWYDK